MPTEQPTEREPMLTKDEVDRMRQADMFELSERRGPDGYVTPEEDSAFEQGYRFAIRRGTAFYESKITSGELIPAKPRPKLAKALHGIKCASHPTVSIVDSWTPVTDEEWDRLLKEGAQIVTP